MTSYIQWHGVAKIVGNISFLEEIITDYRVDMKYARMRYETRKDSNIPRDPHVKTLVKETLIEILSTY